MSLFHYIGSTRKLPLGERGKIKSSDDKSNGKSPKAFRFKSAILPEGATPLEQIFDLSHIKEEEIEVYDSMEDAAGIYIDELRNWNGAKAIRKHFKNPFVYRVSPNWGGFFLSPELKRQLPDEYRASIKCINELFKLMHEFGVDHDYFELYSCWTDEESKVRNDKLTKVIDLKSFTLSDNFELKNRQYI